MLNLDEEGEDNSNDESYTGDGEDAYEDDDSNLDFQCLLSVP